jgi:hypothetical protein
MLGKLFDDNTYKKFQLRQRMSQNLIKDYVETKEHKQLFMLKDLSSYRLLGAQIKVSK